MILSGREPETYVFLFVDWDSVRWCGISWGFVLRSLVSGLGVAVIASGSDGEESGDKDELK